VVSLLKEDLGECLVREFEEENGIEKWIKAKGERLKDRKRIETKTGSFHI